MKIGFHSRSYRFPLIQRKAQKAVRLVFRHERTPFRGHLNVIWTSRREVLMLNRRFRGTDRYTDVIAFRYDKLKTRIRSHPFGDLYIAVPQARANARQFRVPLAEELVRLVIHGTLHLFGYTDYKPKEKKKMWTIQEKIVQKVMHSSSNSGTKRKQ